MVNHKTRSGLWSFPLHATLDKIYVVNQRCHQRDAGSKGLRSYPKIIRETGSCSSTKTHKGHFLCFHITVQLLKNLTTTLIVLSLAQIQIVWFVFGGIFVTGVKLKKMN